ncbi:MAG: sigma-70 family RNA polymerase sigma factor [Sodaliphilus pleomorphus]|uniref:RNA polymerase sigma factor n=1 Tax=Sodaliphilus pleomorphus TaxID=2606626 RepID=UPI0023F3244A|nr:sigma-70 family RNA polymerase sigma factor [Sodaliphilus pleomorphus]MDD7065335.1 sigma-70 family RNA polymerase sigma factor [Sodaliphilus pleomorphus]
MLDTFARKEWPVAQSWLSRVYGLGVHDCEDVFQEAFIVLWNHMRQGRFDIHHDKVGSYFLGICKKKAQETMRKKQRFVPVPDDVLAAREFSAEKSEQLLLTFESEASLREKKETMIRQMLRQMPEPCNKILWAFYFESFSMQEMAELYGYASAAAVKVTKHRCLEKFGKWCSEKFKTMFR